MASLENYLYIPIGDISDCNRSFPLPGVLGTYHLALWFNTGTSTDENVSFTRSNRATTFLSSSLPSLTQWSS